MSYILLSYTLTVMTRPQFTDLVTHINVNAAKYIILNNMVLYKSFGAVEKAQLD